MRTIYVVVHPEAKYHVEKVVGGWHDSPLTTRGVRAAAEIAESLRARIPVDAEVELFSSDLQRARQTAMLIADRLQVTPVFDRRLREKSYGTADGKPQQWLDRRFVPPPAAGERMQHDEGIPGAETKASAAGRVYAFIDSVLDSRREHQVIVTHGFCATFVLAAWIAMPMESAGYVHFANVPGSIIVLHEDDYFHHRTVLGCGETAHLEDPDSAAPSPPSAGWAESEPS